LHSGTERRAKHPGSLGLIFGFVLIKQKEQSLPRLAAMIKEKKTRKRRFDKTKNTTNLAQASGSNWHIYVFAGMTEFIE
jgi:hypothetical protein